MHRAVGPLVPAGVDAVGGQQRCRRARATLAVGNPSSRPRWSPSTTGPRTSCGRPSIAVASSRSPRASACADGRRRHRRRGRRSSADEVEAGSTSKPGSRAHLAEQRDVAAAPVPEVEVLADHDDLGVEAVDEHLARRSPPPAPSLGASSNVRTTRVVDAGRLEQLELLVEVGEQQRRRLRPHDRGRVPVEGDDRGRGRRARRPAACTSAITARWPRCTPSYAPIVTTRALGGRGHRRRRGSPPRLGPLTSRGRRSARRRA